MASIVAAWPTVALGEVLVAVDRAEAPIAGKTYRTVGVKWWGEGVYEREPIDGSQTQYSVLRRIEAGDIIINKIWARHGSVAVVQPGLGGCYASTEFPTWRAVPGKLEPRWMHWLSKMKGFWAQCEEKSRGTSGKNRIRPEKFLEIPIPLPPLDEQRRIVAHIEALAARIEQARGLRREALAEAEALITTTARNVLSNVAAPITPLTRWLNMEREGIQTGPFGAQLGASDFKSDGVPMLTIGNVQFGGLDTTTLKHVSIDKAAQLSRFRIERGDLLFARMGTVGRCCVVPDAVEGWLFNYHIIRVALNRSTVEPRYVHWSIRASADIADYLDDKTRGATRAGVNSNIVGNLPCRIPPLEEQQRIVAHLDAAQTQISSLKQLQTETAAELDALLPSVLDQAFRGEL